MKAHIRLTDSPLGTGSQVKTECGAPIVDARILRVWDMAEMNMEVSWPKGICGKCLKKIQTKTSRERQYTYVLQDSRDRTESQ